MRRAAHVDANQRLIVEALRACGASVFSLAAVGKGCPDLLVGYKRVTYLLEVKNPKGFGVGRKGKRAAPMQQEWREKWAGGEVRVVTTVAEAFSACGIFIREVVSG